MTKKSDAVLAKLARLVACGLSDPEIGHALGVCARTVLRWRHAEGLESRWQPAPAAHGTPGRYERGCRCQACRSTSNRRRSRYYRSVQQETAFAPNHGTRWTPAEDAVLHKLGPRRAAATLGRTYYGCTNRLTFTRRRP